MDAFALQKGSVDANRKSAMCTLPLHLLPLDKSSVLMLSLSCEGAEH